MNDQLYFRNGDLVTVTEHRSAHLKEQYLSFTHPTGLRVYLFPKKLSTTYALYATHFGSADSDFTVNGTPLSLPEGCAHFLEHKMFEEADGSDAFSFFSARGADSNAYTTWDKTAYLFSATDHELECLEALIRFVSDPHFTEESVKKEQGIIAEEIRMGNIDADPCCHSESDSICQYCDWADACHFQDGRDGDHLHYILPVRQEEFWALMEQEAERGGN